VIEEGEKSADEDEEGKVESGGRWGNQSRYVKWRWMIKVNYNKS